MKFLLLTLALAVSFTAQAFTAKIYEQGSNRQKQIASYSNESSAKDGKEELHVVYKDMEGQTLVEEKALLEGSKLHKIEVDHKQTGQKGLVEVKDGKIFFTKTTSDGKSSTKDEKLKDTLVSSSNFARFVKDNWDKVSKGETVGFRYAVWDRQETVGFEIFKIADDKIGDKPVVVLKMKPSSFVIAALVKPIIFVFPADGAHILELNGRVPFKRKDGNSFKDLDAEVVYSY